MLRYIVRLVREIVPMKYLLPSIDGEESDLSLLYSKQCDFCGINLREFSKSTSARVLLLFVRRIFDYECP